MDSTSLIPIGSAPRLVTLRWSRLAIFTMFAVDGVGFGAWAAFLPTFKANLGLSDGGLSIPLFAMVTGSLFTMPVAGRILTRRGSRGVVLVSALCFSSLLPLLALASIAPGGFLLFTLAAMLFGGSKGALDVSANAQAVVAERAGERPLVSACHGFWSLGLLCGSALAAVALEFRVPPPLAMLVAGLALLGLSTIASGQLRNDDQVTSPDEKDATLWPRGRLMSLAILAFFALFCEGAMGDWGAIYLAGEVGVAAPSAAFGYSVYAMAMTVGRFAGDGLVARLGSSALLRVSALFVAAGLGAALALRSYTAALTGFVFVGLGLANMVPILFRSAGREDRAGGAIASVATVGSFGFLIGPPIIGALSRVVGLSHALTVVVAFGVMIAACARLAVDRGR
ncbi:Fucose permease [Singulisphaera sp. GP187]|uniref:MFS transporter n=1 Tax=Singulisphaera sp. GP187 TaxID=1882752 RepID=UPI000926118B|nr:MFS transporter [Singulisphaera sp. GP187]SIN82580.1 Fucose permease [Singulisphaera sp. GP187]